MFHQGGLEVILRSLMGETPAAFTHMSFGVGGNQNSPSRFTEKTLGLEVVRVPIQSSYVELQPTDDALTDLKTDYQAVFKAEIPVSQRIMYNEIGLWPSAKNVQYGDNDSNLIAKCDASEPWAARRSINSADETVELLTQDEFWTNVQYDYYADAYPAFKKSQPRVGGTSVHVPLGEGRYIKKEISLNEFDIEDELKFAFAFTPYKTNAVNALPFWPLTTYIDGTINFAIHLYTESGEKFSYEDAVNYTWRPNQTVNHNAYFVKSYPLSNWGGLKFAKITDVEFVFTSMNAVDTNNQPFAVSLNNSFSLVLDAIRLEKQTTNNPLYSLVTSDFVGYGTSNLLPIEKINGLDGHVEHRIRLFSNSTGESQV